MKHNMYKKVGLLAAGLFAMAIMQPAAAQDGSRNLSLDEAVQMSLQNSKQLKLSKAKIDEAVANYHDTWNNKLPDIKATGAYMRVNNPTVDLKVNLSGSTSGSTTTTGGSENTSASSIKVSQAAYGLVNASLPLFSGLRIHYGVQSAKYLAEAAKLDADNDRDAVVENTIAAYDNLYKAREAVDLVRQNLNQSHQRTTDFSNMEQNGLIARNDLLKTELEESNIQLSLLDAENNLKITYINMDLMLGLAEGTELVPDSSSFDYPADPGSVMNWEQSALQNRKDAASLELHEKAAIANIKATKGEYYPSIALTGGYVAMDIPKLLTVYNAIDGGVGLSYNFGALYKTGAKVHEAQARLAQVQANQEMLSDNIRIQINQAYQNFVLSQKKIDVYAVAIAQATENYNITKNKYDNSLATTTDLLDADVAQLQAKLNYAYAKADAMVAYKKLQQTAGTLEYNKKANK